MSGKNNTNINRVFDEHTNIKIDRELMLKVLNYVNSFVRKTEDSINFFGSNLIGVYPVKWTTEDKMVWIEDILQITDYDKLTQDIWDLPSINKSWQISGDPVNISFLWLAHQALVSKELNEKDREHLARASINMIQYKFISSIHTHNFKYNSNIAIALAVYEQLDNKSQLKRAGSWQAMVDSRTTDILGVDSLHTKTIRTLEDDGAVVKMLNDIWTRIKSIFKILTTDFYRIRDTNARIASSDKFTQVDGEAIIKDYVNEYVHIKSKLHDIVPDKNSFIRDDLLTVISTTVTTVYPDYLKKSLQYISDNYLVKNKQVNLPILIDDILMYAFKVIREEKIDLNNIPTIGIKLRNTLRSSRNIDPEYRSIKERTYSIIEASNYRITDINIGSTRIGLVLYIILRSLISK